MERQSNIYSGFSEISNYLDILDIQFEISKVESLISLIQFLISINQLLISLNKHNFWCHCYTGIQGLNYPELPSRGILGNKEIILFDCTCELCGYEWVGLLDELMSICSVSDNFYTFFK